MSQIYLHYFSEVNGQDDKGKKWQMQELSPNVTPKLNILLEVFSLVDRLSSIINGKILHITSGRYPKNRVQAQLNKLNM